MDEGRGSLHSDIELPDVRDSGPLEGEDGPSYDEVSLLCVREAPLDIG